MQTEDILCLMKEMAELHTRSIITMSSAYIEIRGMRIIPSHYIFIPKAWDGPTYAHAQLVRHWERFLTDLWTYGQDVPKTLVWRQEPEYFDDMYTARLCYVESEKPEGGL